MNTLALLLGQAPWQVVGPVLDRLDPDTRRGILANPWLAGNGITSYVLARGSAAARSALAENPEATPEMLARLADHPTPEVAHLLLRHPHASRASVLRVLPELALPDGYFEIPAGERAQRELYGLAETTDVECVAYAASGLLLDGRFVGGESALARALLNLWRLAGPDAARSALAGTTEMPPGPRGRLQAALDDPDGRQALGRLIEVEGRTARIVERLRALEAGGLGYDPRIQAEPGGAAVLLLFGPHEPLRWDVIAAEHDRAPWSRGSLAAFRVEPGCPAELADRADADAERRRGLLPTSYAAAAKSRRSGRAKSAARHDAGHAARASRAAREAALAQVRRLAGTGTPAVEDAVRTAYRDRVLSAGAIVTQSPSAQATLRVLAQSSGERLDSARTAVARLTDEHLADHVEAWAVALRILPDFAGSLPELLRTARAASGV